MNKYNYFFQYYDISKTGVVTKRKNGKFVKTQVSDSGRFFIRLVHNKQSMTLDLATLLLMQYKAYNKDINKPYVHFIDGNVANIDLSNIQWSSYELKTNPRKRKIGLYTALDKVRIKTFPSVSIAAKEMKCSASSISRVCSTLNKYKGYYWKYLN